MTLSVLRSERNSGQEMTEVLSTSSVPVTTTARLEFVIGDSASLRQPRRREVD